VLAAASVAGKPDRESQKCIVKTGQAAHLSDLEGAVGELSGDVCWSLSACIAFRDWRASAKLVLILAKEISSTFVPRDFTVLYTISRYGTACRVKSKIFKSDSGNMQQPYVQEPAALTQSVPVACGIVARKVYASCGEKRGVKERIGDFCYATLSVGVKANINSCL